METVVDDDVYEWASRHKWSIAGSRGKWYAARGVTVDGKRTTSYLHRRIAGQHGLDVDHINGDTLDNRRANLRSITHQFNQQNRSGGYGRTGERNVYLTKKGRYVVKLQPKSGPLHIGVFDTLTEATSAARTARMEHFPGAIS
jgi:hypothetical protein